MHSIKTDGGLANFQHILKCSDTFDTNICQTRLAFSKRWPTCGQHLANIQQKLIISKLAKFMSCWSTFREERIDCLIFDGHC